MYRSAVILIVAAVLAVVVLLVCAQSLAVVEMLAVVDERVGPAQVQHGNRTEQATIGMLVRAGEHIRTGTGGRIGLHWADGTRAELGPNSELVIARCRMNKMRKTRTTHFRLNLGEIWIRIQSELRPGSKFEVETPTIVAAVRGTIFGLMVAQDGTTEVEVYEGQVQLVGDGIGQTVDSGKDGRCAIVGKRGPEVHRMSAAQAERWREKADVIGPLLNVHDPGEHAITAVALAPVWGTTEEAAKVTVNGEPVRVTSRGVFRTRARLTEGPNVVTIISSLGLLHASATREVTYLNPTHVIALTSRPSMDPHDPPGVIEVTAVLRNNHGELVADGTPVQLMTSRGAVTRHNRTKQGAVVARWRPDARAGSARITAMSGHARATIVISSRSGVAAPSGPS